MFIDSKQKMAWRPALWAVGLALLTACGGLVAAEPQTATAGDPDAGSDYREPSPAVTALLTAPPPPTPLVHARSRQVALLYREPVIPLAWLVRPRLGLAGYRFDPESRLSDIDARVSQVQVVSADPAKGESPVIWQPGAGDVLEFVRFSPDGRTLSALSIGNGPARLVLFDVASGREQPTGVPVNPAWGEPCSWVANDELLCRVIPPERGDGPVPRTAPIMVEQERGIERIRTYSNLLENSYEDALFDYHFSVALARVDLSGQSSPVPGPHGLIRSLDPSPDGRYAMVTRLQRPYPRLAPARRFPSVVEVWDLARGERLYASSPKGVGVDEELLREDPRRGHWMPGSSNTLGFIYSSRDEADQTVHQWLATAAPFSGDPRIVASSRDRILDFGWTTEGTPWFTTRGDSPEEIRAFIVEERGPQQIWSGSVAKAYENPGTALRVDGSDGPVLEARGRIFLAGDGLSDEGPRPFLDLADLRQGSTERVFAAAPNEFETVLAVLDPDLPAFITSRETVTEGPNLYLHRGDERTALTELPNPYPQLAGVTRRVEHYQRADGLALSGTLYLPADRHKGERLPTLIWIYPYEYSDREQAEQLDVRAFRYHRVKGPSPLAAVVAGYAVLVNPAVPIVQDESAMNDDYLQQLVASVEAAVDHLVDSGVTDPGRVAVGGRSYGAFSSANLLIHSDRFATAVAMSGAYNRTLTPFGFQHEKRTFWEATELYTSISPFFFADRVKAPILLMHGGSDENPGTPTFQGRRFFHALVGEGKAARYVELPYEGHHYWARENVLLAAAEMIDWLDRIMGRETK